MFPFLMSQLIYPLNPPALAVEKITDASAKRMPHTEAMASQRQPPEPQPPPPNPPIIGIIIGCITGMGGGT